MTPTKKRAVVILSVVFAAGILLTDRLVKSYILSQFSLGEVRDFIPGVLQLTYVRNPGIAFSFLAGQPWIPLVLTPILLLVVGVLLVRNIFPCPVQRLALVSVMAGGLSNWIDRLAYGHVVDMFATVFMNFAIFNVADIFITLGGITFFVAYVVSERKKSKAKPEEQPETPDE